MPNKRRKKSFKCSPEVYRALVDLSETLFLLVNMNHNYSERVANQLSKALTSINNLITIEEVK
jgi:hypothetical protein